MAVKLPPPPLKAESTFDDWMRRFYGLLDQLGGGGGATVSPTNHATLANLDSEPYSHISGTQKTDLTDGGDSSLHFHSGDRNRSNHFGTQTSDTISDFSVAVAAIATSTSTGASGSILEGQIFGG